MYARTYLNTWLRRTLAGPVAVRGAAYAASYEEAARFEVAGAPPGELETYFEEHTEGPGLWKWRHYFPIYERHLARFRDREITFAEIGIYSGGSLAMWRHYLGPKALIVGVDIQPACSAYEAPGVQVYIGDQGDRALWPAVLADHPVIDVLIDDGGHEHEQQIVTFEAVFPHIAPGGVYLCEDIHGEAHHFHDYLDSLSRGLHHTGPDFRFSSNALQRSIDSIHIYPFVTVVEKRATPLSVLEAPKHGTQWQPFYEGSPAA